MRVTVRNFQSLKEVTLDVDGLTVVEGPSDLGKSALLRAIQAALFNRAGDDFVRHGASYAEVIINGLPTADGNTLDVIWRKGKNKNEFIVNGERYASVGKGAPQPILDAGYRDVGVGAGGDETIRPNVATQFDRLFLLDRPGSFVADVLTTLSRVNTVATAEKLCATDVRKTKSTLNLRRGDLEALDRQLEATADVDALYERVTELARHEEALAVNSGYVEQMRERVGRRRALLRAKDLSLPARVDVPEDLGAQWAVLRDLVALRKGLLTVTGLPLPEGVYYHGELVMKGESVEALRRWVATRQALLRAVERQLPDPVDLSDIPANRYATLAECVAVRRRVVVAAGLQMPAVGVRPEKLDQARIWVERVATLSELVTARKQALDTLRTSEASVNAARVLEEEARGALDVELAAAKVCPICNQPTVKA